MAPKKRELTPESGSVETYQGYVMFIVNMLQYHLFGDVHIKSTCSNVTCHLVMFIVQI